MKNIKIISLVVIALIFALQPILFAKYISVVDSGSTGSMIHLFDIVNNDGIIQYKVIPLKNNDKHIGLANVFTPEEIPEYISPLIESLKKGLPTGVSESDIDFYFMATGDMRSVSPHRQKNIYTIINEYLAKNTKLNLKIVGTMPEKMEGAFDWIGLNLFEDRVGTSSTYGLIDIGGATIEVAYEVDGPSENTQKIKIGKNTYFVHSRSYLGIGNDHLREQFLDNPNCIPRGLSMVTTTGNGNYNQCLSDVKILLDGIHNVEPIPASVLVKTQFVGLAYFYYLTNCKPFSLGSEVSLSDIKSKAEEFSKISWEEMKIKWPHDQYLYGYYIGSVLIIDLLQRLGFDPDTKIKAALKVDGDYVSWALGVAVYYAEGNK